MENNSNKSSFEIISGAICGILMILSIIAYLLFGFLANLWHPGWIIVVCTALLCGIVGIIGNLCTSLKLIKKEKENNETK